jgi:hypothetical protein
MSAREPLNFAETSITLIPTPSPEGRRELDSKSLAIGLSITQISSKPPHSFGSPLPKWARGKDFRLPCSRSGSRGWGMRGNQPSVLPTFAEWIAIGRGLKACGIKEKGEGDFDFGQTERLPVNPTSSQ